jgi:uncharacterized membrane protein YedE/YeeE
MGIALGAVLLASFVVAQRGIGASGAFAVVAGKTLHSAVPNVLERSPGLADRLPWDGALWNDWGFLEIVGVVVGGALSAWLSGRLSRSARERASHETPRLTRSVAGGVLMGVGARLSYGCTSGLALSGGALLATGAWLFIFVAFATAIAITLIGKQRGLSAGASHDVA